MIKLLLLITTILFVLGCSNRQMAEVAYGSAKSSECLKKEGVLECDLADEDSGSSTSSIPNTHSNEALERIAEENRKSEED